MAEPTLEIVRGSSGSWTVTLLDDEAEAITTYTGSETLDASVWPGDDVEELFAPTAAWLSAPAGTVTLTVSAVQSATLTPGSYSVSLSVDTAIVRVGRLLVLPGPGGTADPPAVYGTYDDMRRVAGSWLADLQESGSDQTGFREQRGTARAWFDGILQRHYRRDTGIARQDSLDHLLIGIGARYGEHDTTLQDWLDDDRLVLTTPAGKRIVECVSRYAVALVCEAQISGKPDDVWRDRARMFRSRAQNDVASITAEIDTTSTADGVGDLVIDLGTADRLRA